MTTPTPALDVQIAAVLEEHQFDKFLRDCSCGRWRDSGPGWQRVLHNYHEHAAAMVTDLLVDLAGTGRLLASIDLLYRQAQS